jgi:hypothetical protein
VRAPVAARSEAVERGIVALSVGRATVFNGNHAARAIDESCVGAKVAGVAIVADRFVALATDDLAVGVAHAAGTVAFVHALTIGRITTVDGARIAIIAVVALE